MIDLYTWTTPNGRKVSIMLRVAQDEPRGLPPRQTLVRHDLRAPCGAAGNEGAGLKAMMNAECGMMNEGSP